jgi:hypothetical protein
MIRRFSCTPVFLAIILLFVSPASAGLVLSDVSFSPDAPLVPGGQQGVVATYTVIPAGSSTFSPGHELQIGTGLLDAQWTMQVTLDGRNAARQTGSGSVVFVNGALLSYSTDHDVGMVVTVDGIVPQNAGGSLSVLQITELDNAGNAVPGSNLTISQPVAGASPAATSVIPTLTPPLATTTVPGAAPGFAVPAIVAAVIAAVLLTRAVREY